MFEKRMALYAKNVSNESYFAHIYNDEINCIV